MAGVGKLLKQAQRMQRGISEAQQRLAQERIEVSHGGGAVRVVVNGHGDVVDLSLNPEFLRDDPAVVQAALLSALQEAAGKARSLHEETMSKATAGFQLPGF
ncbi:MAG: YbaB/EbfC family nucleoid-associated protein [Opitutia bacterium]|jgi:DNA-binding YbaB/EbfC family protein